MLKCYSELFIPNTGIGNNTVKNSFHDKLES